MRAAILSIGDELVLGETRDTNAPWLAGEMARHGVICSEVRVIGDDREQIAGAIDDLSSRNDLLILTGGLGPTHDDLTRFALGDVVDPGRELVRDQLGIDHLDACFAGRGKRMPKTNLVQADRPPSTRFIPNPRGTALGLAASRDGCDIYVLPGPPGEMKPMWRDHVEPGLPDAGETLVTASVHQYGLGESAAATLLGRLTERGRTPVVGITASRGVVTARIRASGRPDVVGPDVDRIADEVERAWTPYVFGRDGRTLAEEIVSLLERENATLATVESCTGGWLGKRLVDVGGCSVCYTGGWITYADEMKRDCVKVGQDLLDAHGAVSAEVARAMASGALQAAGVDYAIATTGIAGPDGGSDEKPVGTVYIAVAARQPASVRVRRFEFKGDRGSIRDRSVTAALQMLRFGIIDVPRETPLLWERRRDSVEAGR